MDETEKYWDVFISHASEDKDTIVRELAELLTKLKLKVWYDEFSLKVGDSLSTSIDEGLQKSKFGIVIISKSFLEKRWTDYEYRSLLSKEDKAKVILPVWHNIIREDVKKFSLYLADKLALDISKMSVNKLALTLVEEIRPDIAQSIRAYFLFKEVLKKAKPAKAKLEDLKQQDKPQSKLSKHLEVRARNIHYGIGQSLKFSVDESIYNYELDLNPGREIHIWEIMNVCYLEICKKHNIEEEKIKCEVANLLVGFSIGNLYKADSVPGEMQFELFDLWKKYFNEY